MARNEPSRAVPTVRERIARADGRARFGERECVQSGVCRSVAANLHEAHVDPAGRTILQEMMEVVFLLRRGQARLVRQGRQEKRALRIVRYDSALIASLQGLVPSVEQRRDLL